MYGHSFGKCLNGQASSYESRSLVKGKMAITELRYVNPQFTLSAPPAEQDAFMVGHYLELSPRYEYWEDGRAAPLSMIRPGETIIYDLKRKPTFHLNHSFHAVHYCMSRAALDDFADEVGVPRIQDLRYRAAVATDDGVIRSLSAGLLYYLARPDQASRLLMNSGGSRASDARCLPWRSTRGLRIGRSGVRTRWGAWHGNL